MKESNVVSLSEERSVTGPDLIADNSYAARDQLAAPAPKVFSVVYSFLWLVVLLGVFAGHLFWLSQEHFLMLSGKLWKLGAVVLALWFGVKLFVLYKRDGSGQSSLWANNSKTGIIHQIAKAKLIPAVFLFGCFVFLISDLPLRRFGYFGDFGMRLDIFFIGILAVVFSWMFKTPRQAEAKLFGPTLVLIVQLVLLAVYASYVGKRVLFGDDHPSFIYRLYLLREHFPILPFFNAQWNAGYVSREFFPSGMMNVFILFSPLIYAWSDWSSYMGLYWYSYLIPAISVFIAPWSVFWAARIWGYGRSVAWLAALLSMGINVSVYEWLLSYGTLGFALSMAVSPLSLALSYRLAISKELPKWRHVFCLLISSFLTVTWSLSCFIFIPIVFYALWGWRHLLEAGRLSKVLVFTLGFLVINLPWMSIFIRESKVVNFVQGSSLPGSTSKNVYKGVLSKKGVDAEESRFSWITEHEMIDRADGALNHFRRLVSRLSPVMLLLIWPAFSRRRTGRPIVFLASTCLWLFILMVIGEEWKPQLELRRLNIPISYFATLPIASLIVAWLRLSPYSQDRAGTFRAKLSSLSYLFCTALLLGLIYFIPLRVAQALVNRTDDRFVLAPLDVDQLAYAIRDYGGSGRTFFSGFVLHDLGATSWERQDGGHVAPLAMLSGKELYASDFYHTKWSAVDPIPVSYLKRGEAGIEEFLDLINATAVTTHLAEWRDYFRRTPGYREVSQVGRFRLFVRERAINNWFLQGSGQVSQVKRGLRVKLDSDEAVIKYRYFPRMKSSNKNFELFPAFAFEENLGAGRTQPVNFVGIRKKSQGPNLEAATLQSLETILEF